MYLFTFAGVFMESLHDRKRRRDYYAFLFQTVTYCALASMKTRQLVRYPSITPSLSLHQNLFVSITSERSLILSAYFRLVPRLQSFQLGERLFQCLKCILSRYYQCPLIPGEYLRVPIPPCSVRWHIIFLLNTPTHFYAFTTCVRATK